ncbi:MAG: putative 2OG-Fe(II) oxygenase [Gammaproteobacteria bacterium]
MMPKAQVNPIFPEAIVEVSNVGIDQEKIQSLYAQQEWTATNPDDNAEYFLQISKNLKVLNGDNEFRSKILGMVNEYARDVMRYKNKFYLTTSWFVKTEKNKISVMHNHGNAMISAVYYFGLAKNTKAKIIFERPFQNQFDLKPIDYNIFNGPSHKFELGNDSLIIFPSHLKHKVVRHENPETRKSLAMNFMPKGMAGAGTTELDLGDSET